MIQIVKNGSQTALDALPAVALAKDPDKPASGHRSPPGDHVAGRPTARKRDLLGEWRSHRQIDERQFQAGQRFVRMIERAGMHGHASIDLGAVRVDRSPVGIAAAARVTMAKAEMIELRQVLGVTDFALVCRVIGEGHDLSGAAVETGGSTQVDTHAGGEARRRYLAARIRDALALLAVRFAMETEMA